MLIALYFISQTWGWNICQLNLRRVNIIREKTNQNRSFYGNQEKQLCSETVFFARLAMKTGQVYGLVELLLALISQGIV